MVYYIKRATTIGQGFLLPEISRSAQLAITPALLVVVADNQLSGGSWLGFQLKKERR